MKSLRFTNALKSRVARASFLGALTILSSGAWAQAGLHCAYQISGAPFAEVELYFSDGGNFLPEAKVIFYSQSSFAHVQEEESNESKWKLRLNQSGEDKALFVEISRELASDGKRASTLTNPDMPFMDRMSGSCLEI